MLSVFFQCILILFPLRQTKISSRPRDVWNALLNMCDGAFCENNGWKLLTDFAKRLYHRCLTSRVLN